MTWNERIKEARLDAGLSNGELARAVGVKPASVTQWENGQTKNLDAANCLKAAHVLNVRPHWLVFGGGPKRATDRKIIQRVLDLLGTLSDEDAARAEAVLRTMFQDMSAPVKNADSPDPHAIAARYSPAQPGAAQEEGAGSTARTAGRTRGA